MTKPRKPSSPGARAAQPAPRPRSADRPRPTLRTGPAAAGSRPPQTGAALPRSGSPPLGAAALLAVYRPDISRALDDAGAPAFRHTQVLEHLMHRPQRPFSEATALPADLRSHLTRLGDTTLKVVASQTASDGTVKSLMSAPDGASVETVLMPYRERTTICISSQVGCPVGCLFCATGGMGLQRNLTVGEIVDQVTYGSALVTSQGRRITNVVYMGMGEPLLNLGAVLGSIQVLTAPQGLGMAHRSLSVSTIGIPAGIRRLGREQPQVNLALSLHAADDETRGGLVPEGFRHPLAEILDAAWDHFALTHRKLLVEYVLLDGVNDSPDDARRLAALLRGHVVTVNLLVWNPTSRSPKTGAGAHERSTRQSPGFRPSSAAAVATFRSVLNAVHVETVLRQSRGRGIQAACGQLAGRLQSYQTKD